MEKKHKKQYFTRKNFIALSLVCLYAILLIFTAVNLDGGLAAKSDGTPKSGYLLAQMAAGMGFPLVDAGAAGYVCVGLIAVYAAVFTAAFIYEMRYAVANNKSVWSWKMVGIYAATLAICIFLSFGIGILTQPVWGGDNVGNLLAYMGQCLVISILLYLVLFVFIGAIVMLVVNFIKVNKPFDFFDEKSMNVPEDDETIVPVSENFDVDPAAAVASAAAAPGGFAAGAAFAGEGGVQASSAELDDREKVFPALCKIDGEYGGYAVEKIESDDVTLQSLCEGFRNYLAKVEHLYYDLDTIRIFISGLHTSHLLLLEGLSGTGKSSLPRYFAKYVNGKVTFLAVQATWRDRTNLLGYFNDFSKTYNETEFLSALYEANYDEDRLNFFVLDELNISRVEYYFADFLSVLEYPISEWRLKLMQLPYNFIPPAKLEEGYVRIPENAYFVGTANKDDSTFSIADKVYDRAITIDFDNRNAAFEVSGEAHTITLGKSKLYSLFAEADARAENALTKEDYRKFGTVSDFIYDEFDIAFGNRVLNQIAVLVPTFVACGGVKEDALDFLLARKILVKLEGRFEDYIKPKLKELLALLASVYGAGVFKKSEKAVNNLLRKL